jgi:hypothetical protein
MGKKDFKNVIQHSVNGHNLLNEVLGINTEVAKIRTAIPDSQSNNDSTIAKLEPKIKKTKKIDASVKHPVVKMSFNMEGSLHERLRSYVFETRDNKTAVIHSALDKLLKGKGY